MATDEAILKACGQNNEKSTLRLYEWKEPTLSLGCFQKSENIVKCCLNNEIPYVRRVTGGRAVLHADEITYSIICGANDPLFSEGITGAYKIISKCLLEAFIEAGINVEMHNTRCKMQDSKKTSCFHSPSRYEIMIENNKIVGSAQRRFKEAFLQHGSILFGIEKDLIKRLFGKEALSTMACIKYYRDINKEEFKSILVNKLIKGLNISLTVGKLNDNEIYLRDKLIQQNSENIIKI